MKRLLKTLFMIGFILSSIGLLIIVYYQVKAETAQWLLDSAWQQSLQQKSQNPVKPWSWADTWPVLKLELPSLQLSSVVLKDASGQSLAFGPGLMTPDKLPGEPGNSFIAAHRDTHFEQLVKLKTGELVTITNRLGEKLAFKIDHLQIVDSRIEQPVTETQERRITLVTCYQSDNHQANTPYRYLVSAVLVK
jgi:sortase A